MTYIKVLSLALLVAADAFVSPPSHQRRSIAVGASTVTPLSTSSKTEEEFIDVAKDFIDNPSPDKMADDFVFRGPVIGPLCKKDYVATLTSMSAGGKAGFDSAFPDLQSDVFGFTVDPIEPNRVWYFVRSNGTFTGPFDSPTAGRLEPTGAKYISPPEARSILIDNEGKVKYQSVGYSMDRFTGDTTNGKAAVFGLYEVMGQPLDDTIGSWKMVALQWLTSVLPDSLEIPKSYSKKEDLPSWWTDDRMGAQK